MDPLRTGLEPRRLASGAVAGVILGVVSILYLGSEGPKVVLYAGVALAVLVTAPWILSLLYVRTERGRAARAANLGRRRDGYLVRWGNENRTRREKSRGHGNERSD